MAKKYRSHQRGERVEELSIGGHVAGSLHKEILQRSDQGAGGDVLLPNRFRTKKR